MAINDVSFGSSRRNGIPLFQCREIFCMKNSSHWCFDLSSRVEKAVFHKFVWTNRNNLWIWFIWGNDSFRSTNMKFFMPFHFYDFLESVRYWNHKYFAIVYDCFIYKPNLNRQSHMFCFHRTLQLNSQVN